MANASIFQQYLQPPRSVQDYASDMDKADANRLGLLHQQGVNALQALTNQQTQQSIADDQAVRQATIASNGDQNALLRALNAGGQYKASQALQKTQLDNLKTKSDIGLADAHAGKFTQETEAGKVMAVKAGNWFPKKAVAFLREKGWEG